jgi:hypothetical protein
MAALSVLTSVVLGGHRYFYCAHMDEVSLDACCARPDTAARTQPAQAPAVGREACCVTKHFASPAPTSVGSSEIVVRAPVATVLAPPIPPPTPNAPSLWVGRIARAGPDRWDPRDHRVRLMVSLT